MGTIYSADCHTCPLRLSSPWSIVAERSRAPLAMAKMLDQVMMPATGVARGIRVPSVVHRVTNKVMELVSAKHLHCTPGGYFVAIDVEPELLDKGVDVHGCGRSTARPSTAWSAASAQSCGGTLCGRWMVRSSIGAAALGMPLRRRSARESRTI